MRLLILSSVLTGAAASWCVGAMPARCRQSPQLRSTAWLAATREEEEDEDVAAARSFLNNPGLRPTSGREAFEGTTWSVLMRMDEGGSTIFTLQLGEGDVCRFSDTDRNGKWECEGEYVAFEKPKGFFEDTLYYSAKLLAPASRSQRWRLVDGLVQRGVTAGEGNGGVDAADAADTADAGAAPDSGAGAAGASAIATVDADASADAVHVDAELFSDGVQLVRLGSFGANEFEEPLLAGMRRFADEEESDYHDDDDDDLDVSFT